MLQVLMSMKEIRITLWSMTTICICLFLRRESTCRRTSTAVLCDPSGGRICTGAECSRTYNVSLLRFCSNFELTRCLLRYEEMSRMMSSLVPWNDPQQLHNIITNICPEFLTPGAVIDIKNVLILDERIDFVCFLFPIQRLFRKHAEPLQLMATLFQDSCAFVYTYDKAVVASNSPTVKSAC